MNSVLVIVLSLILAACAGPIAKGSKFIKHTYIANNASLVYLYKPYSNDGVTVCLKVLLNDIERGCLSGKGFIRLNLEPGNYKVVLKPDAFLTHNLMEFDVSLQPNQVSYFEYTTTSDTPPKDAVAKRFYSFAGISGHNLIVEREENDALKTLSRLFESN
ncbi:hypothetical protein Patl_0902 [Paraglaciecola sp. T6c]|uniref:DUF2846 domain-containing protein n=1 Tax=Pseudoalteromonas atlantica (strain T6c / ATCC BAA-1087) TaxID=3042615 RepID=UPI00005C58B3|nr:DUF2846 domain-containing protein [Paraglaciecola sp. T6c]ABG39428.1 hypothetical protein Patl_0902 [Paraglaciecola sp. T6c]